MSQTPAKNAPDRYPALAWALLGGLVVGCGGGADRADASHGPGTGAAPGGAGAGGGVVVGVDGSGGETGGQSDGARAADGPAANVAPGGNFDLSLWELQEPVGAPGSPTTIGPAALAGPNGFQDSYFFTDPSDGAMTFWDPESGVTTPDSSYPRSELREMNADGSAANWPIAGTNTLSATVAVTQVPDHLCVGQIHLGTAIQAGLTASTKPLVELYDYATGDIEIGIEDDPTGGQTLHDVTNVPLGTKFSYTLQLTGDGTITLAINGATYTFTMPPAFSGYGQYFKAGDYDQTAGSDPAVGATVKLYALQVSH